MGTISIPPSFSELEVLDDGDLEKLVRMAKAVLHERGPVTRPSPVPTGRPTSRTSRIAQAFEDVPTTPVDAEEFATRHGIGVTTLRQQKRFDPLHKEGGDRVYVKKSKRDGRLYVWRGADGSLDDF